MYPVKMGHLCQFEMTDGNALRATKWRMITTKSNKIMKMIKTTNMKQSIDNNDVDDIDTEMKLQF